MRRFLGILLLPFILAGCAAEPVWAPQEMVDRVRFRQPGPSEVVLYTAINAGSGNGAHSSILVNASERVIFDPAGNFAHETIPERNDVIFGITPYLEDVYVRYHARITYHVRVQRLEVSPEVAEIVLQRVKAYGAVPKAHCSRAVSTVLQGVPGFEHIKTTWSPIRLSDSFGQVPTVSTSMVIETDADDKETALATIVPENALAQ